MAKTGFFLSPPRLVAPGPFCPLAPNSQRDFNGVYLNSAEAGTRSKQCRGQILLDFSRCYNSLNALSWVTQKFYEWYSHINQKHTSGEKLLLVVGLNDLHVEAVHGGEHVGGALHHDLPVLRHCERRAPGDKDLENLRIYFSSYFLLRNLTGSSREQSGSSE